ncbi:MAG: HAD-IA family hydrolase [Proteobacteria bacterium]|nr:HAD-IA family hydrolase [Pseudomonadota bacterium]NIS69282.1 HAD-IA family hydrolase [Pseudomonadota bacterium]
MGIEAVVFDYDGTLVQLNIDFDAMRRGVERLLETRRIDRTPFTGLYVLETIDKAAGMLSQEDREAGRSLYRAAIDLVTELELQAAKKGKILNGVVEVLCDLKNLGIKVGIITRNCEQAVRVSFPHIEELCDIFIPRDHVAQVKPHPAHLTLALEKMAVKNPRDCLMVGDHVLDIEAGKRIGMKTAGVLTGHTTSQQFVEAEADFILQDATAVLECIHKGEKLVEDSFLQSGKLDIQILEKLLRQYALSDARVLIGPRIGEDTAAIDMGERVLIVTTDPITFATDQIGYYSVVVNANDIATSGAEPRWFTANILLPEKKANKALVNRIFEQIHRACKELGISLIGGHTEITHGLDRPIVIGHMMGEVEKQALVTTGGAKVGDEVLLSKGICIEGTSIIAREKAEELLSRGISRELIERAQGFLFDPGISVIREARMAWEAGRIHSMHDVTEGGLANGLHEIAIAAEVEIVIHKAQIPVFEESRVICEALGLDPLGVIASGALVITAPPMEAEKVLDRASREGLAIGSIGRVDKGKPSVSLITDGRKEPVPYFSRDELVKIFEEPSQSPPIG